MNRIRHIATSWSGARVAVAQIERRAAVWDVEAGTEVCEFDCIVDFGGRRLAISEDGQFVIAAAYLRNGIAGYDANSGDLLWQRRDLKKTQSLAIIDHERVFCGFDGKAGYILDIRNGQTIRKLPGIGHVYVSPFDMSLFLDRKSRDCVIVSVDGQERGQIERTTFAFLDAAFSGDRLLTSESTGPIRCFSTTDARELWRHSFEGGTHALRVAYDADDDCFLAIVWEYMKGSDTALYRIDSVSGRLKSIVKWPSAPDYGFCKRGSMTFTWSGAMIQTKDAAFVRLMKFPPTYKK